MAINLGAEPNSKDLRRSANDLRRKTEVYSQSPLTIRRCHAPGCAAYKRPYRPEAEGAVALPRHEFGLDVVALIGRLRYAEHRSVPEIRTHLVGRGVAVSERTVTNLLDRYDELLAVALADNGG